jgi:hypothetical protein
MCRSHPRNHRTAFCRRNSRETLHLHFPGPQKKRFELPPKAVAIDDYYCNDSTYGNINILCVTRVVRLDSSMETASHHMKKCSEFDAWPVGGDIGGDGYDS